LEELLETNGCNARDLTNAEIILEEMSVPKDEQILEKTLREIFFGKSNSS